jgi:hypothetical protein
MQLTAAATTAGSVRASTYAMFTPVSIDTANTVTTEQLLRNHCTPYTVARVPFERLLPLCASKLGSLQKLTHCVGYTSYTTITHTTLVHRIGQHENRRPLAIPL